MPPQAKRRAASYAVQLKTLDEQHKDLNAQRAAAAAEAAQKRQEDAVAHAVAAAAAAKAAALRADKAKPVLHTPHAPIMPQAVSKHPSWHLADADTPMSRVEAAEAAAIDKLGMQLNAMPSNSTVNSRIVHWSCGVSLDLAIAPCSVPHTPMSPSIYAFPLSPRNPTPTQRADDGMDF